MIERIENLIGEYEVLSNSLLRDLLSDSLGGDKSYDSGRLHELNKVIHELKRLL